MTLAAKLGRSFTGKARCGAEHWTMVTYEVVGLEDRKLKNKVWCPDHTRELLELYGVKPQPPTPGLKEHPSVRRAYEPPKAPVENIALSPTLSFLKGMAYRRR